MGKTMRQRWLKHWLAAGALTPLLAAGCAGKCAHCGGGGFIAEGPPQPPAMTYVYADGPAVGSVSTASEGNFLTVVDVPPSKSIAMTAAKRALPSPSEIKAVALKSMPPAETTSSAKSIEPADDVPVAPTKPMPKPKNEPAPRPVEPTWVETAKVEPVHVDAAPSVVPVPEDVKPAFVASANGYAHAADYAWLAGELQYSKGKGWRLRYASVEETDDYGGSVTLMEDSRLETLKDGQMVKVRGRVVNADGKSIAPSYKIEAVEAQ